MGIDEAMKFVDVQEHVKNRRPASRETISLCLCLTGIAITPLISGEAVLHIIGFMAPVSLLLGDVDIDQFGVFAGKHMANALLPFATTTLYMMSSRKR
jgi:hypothetical protein